MCLNRFELNMGYKCHPRTLYVNAYTPILLPWEKEQSISDYIHKVSGISGFVPSETVKKWRSRQVKSEGSKQGSWSMECSTGGDDSKQHLKWAQNDCHFKEQCTPPIIEGCLDLSQTPKSRQSQNFSFSIEELRLDSLSSPDLLKSDIFYQYLAIFWVCLRYIF